MGSDSRCGMLPHACRSASISRRREEHEQAVTSRLSQGSRRRRGDGRIRTRRRGNSVRRRRPGPRGGKGGQSVFQGLGGRREHAAFAQRGVPGAPRSYRVRGPRDRRGGDRIHRRHRGPDHRRGHRRHHGKPQGGRRGREGSDAGEDDRRPLFVGKLRGHPGDFPERAGDRDRRRSAHRRDSARERLAGRPRRRHVLRQAFGRDGRFLAGHVRQGRAWLGDLQVRPGAQLQRVPRHRLLRELPHARRDQQHLAVRALRVQGASGGRRGLRQLGGPLLHAGRPARQGRRSRDGRHRQES